MNLPIPTKMPVVIISSPRTGSNALAHYYATKYDLTDFSEPDANEAIENSAQRRTNSNPKRA